MKKNTMMLILVSLIACFLIFACINPMSGGEETVEEGKGVITISIGGKSARTVVSWANTLDSANLVHKVTVSGGQEGPHVKEIPAGGGTADFSVIPGQWTISVEAYYSGELVAVGSQTRQINEGDNGTVTIHMQEPASFPKCTVTFNPNGGTLKNPADSSQSVNKYSKAARPEPPTQSGKGFVDWYTDTSSTVPYNFEAAVTGAITLYAKWSDTVYTVIFYDTDNTTEVSRQTIGEGGKASPVKKAGYTATWYKETSRNTVWNFGSDTVTANTSLYVTWTATKYIVKYETNGGTPGTIPDKTNVLWGDKNLLPAQPTKPGCTFAGWDVVTGGSRTNVQNTDAYSDLATDDTVLDITLKAQWTDKTYAVNYDTNSATSGSITAKTGVKWGDKDLLPASNPARTGYTFGGWNVVTGGSQTNVQNSHQYSNLATNDTVASITLQAQWTANIYTVTFNKNGGTTEASPTSKTVTVPATTIDALPAAPTKTGYNFDGWNTKEDGSGSAFTAATSVTGSITVYAKWANYSYDVTYAKNDGSNTNHATKTVASPATTVGALPTAPTRTGYKFVIWNTEKDGSGSAFAANTPVTGNITVYAQWTAKNEIRVNFNANGGDTPTPTNKTVTFDAAYGDLAAISRNAYSFDGWYTQATGGTIVTSGTIVSDENEHTLYARWTPLNGGILVTFDKNTTDSTNGPNPATKGVTDNAAYGALAAISRTGYSFDGWYTQTTGGAQVTDTTTVTNASAHSLYAHWTAITYKVHFDGNGATVTSMADQSFTYDVQQRLRANTYTKNGYGFVGWSKVQSSLTNEYIDEQLVSNLTATANDTVTLYAIWNPVGLTVTFDANGGGTPTPASKTVAFDAAYGDLAAISRAGYTFDGWFDAATGGARVTATTNVTNASAHSLYAHWTPISYTVAFNSNGGTGSIASMPFTYGTAQTLPLANSFFTKYGYLCTGWTTEQYSGRTDYNDGASVSNLTTTPNGTVTLYALWSAPQSAVTFNANGGQAPSTPSTTVTFGTAYGTLATISRTGYSFAGWFTQASGGTEVTVATIVAIEGNHTLYAHWTAETYTVTFKWNDGTGNDYITKTVTAPATTIGGAFPSDPSRTGYSFKEWNTQSNGGGSAFTATTGVTGNITVYAVWLKTLTINTITPPLTPVTPLDTTTFTVTVNGFNNPADATSGSNVALTVTGTGLSFSGNNAAGGAASGSTRTFTVTVTNTNATANNVSVSVELGGTPPSGYAFGSSSTVLVSAINGLTSADPIPVKQSNIAAFNTFANANLNRARYYELTQNIVLSGANNWTPIGGSPDVVNRRFTGSFDGKGYTITGLDIPNNNGYIGMFGNLYGGTIKNVGLVGVNIVSSGNYVGGIVGYMTPGSTLENCFTTGSVEGGQYVGGVAGGSESGGSGSNPESIFQNCYSTAAVKGTTSVGGIVGYLRGGISNGSSLSSKINYCYFTGTVEADSTAGGVIGNLYIGNGSNVVALNKTLKASADWMRVAWKGSGSYSLNGLCPYARSDMTNPLGVPYTTFVGNNGADITAADYNNQTWWTTAGNWKDSIPWDFTTVWQWNSTTQLPILRGFAAGTQNHTVTP